MKIRFILFGGCSLGMDLNSILYDFENDRIGFEDKISLAFMVIGAIFIALIVLSVALNALQFNQVEFESPFF
jgi:hypothetical protein